MKRILLIIAAAIVVLVGAMTVRTLMVAPLTAVASAPPVSIDTEMAARHLAEAIRFRTISYGNKLHEDERNAQLDALRTWMKQTYPAFHNAATREVFGHSLLFTWQGSDPKLPPVLLMAHMDVVPVVPETEKDWTHDPFSGDIADGYVWGRGAIDDKGCLIGLLEAANSLAASGFKPKRTIMFAFGQDEEVGGSEGNFVIARTLQGRGVHFAWILDEGGAILTRPLPGINRPVAFVAVAEKGYLSLKLVARGEGGHSSRPTDNMAVPRLAAAVLKVMHRPFASGLDDVQRRQLSVLAPLWPFGTRMVMANLWLTAPLVERIIASRPEGAATLHTTIAPTMLDAGVKDNVIPPDASAVINFRLNRRDSIAGVIDHVRKAVNDPKVDIIALTETQNEASAVADMDSDSYKYLSLTIRRSFDGVPVAPVVLSGATDSHHYLPIAGNIYRLDPFHFGPDDLARIHGTNERLSVKDAGQAAGFYLRLIRDMP